MVMDHSPSDMDTERLNDWARSLADQVAEAGYIAVGAYAKKIEASNGKLAT